MKKKRFKILTITVVLLIFAMNVLSACSLFGLGINSVNFIYDEIILNVGDNLAVSSYLEFAPSYATDKSFTLQSSDESVLKVVEEMSVSAVSEGEVTLTATTNLSSKKAQCIVKVSKNEPKSVQVCIYGNQYQSISNTSYIEFYADFNGVYAPHKNVSWSIKSNGAVVKAETIEAAEPLSFIPDKLGAYSVTAKITDSDGVEFIDEKSFGVFENYITPPSLKITGETVQDGGSYSKIDFFAQFTDSAQNPQRAVEWKVNGQTAGNETEFSFMPQSAGLYEIELYINGEKIDGTKVIAKGALIPQNIRAAFDNCYPDVKLYWDMPNAKDYGFDFVAQVSDGTGALIKELNSSIASDAKYFDGNSVNFGAFIGASSAKNIFNTSFSFRVKSLGEKSGIFSGSDYSDIVNLDKVLSAAKTYLAQKYYTTDAMVQNYYISDKDEFSQALGYIFMWRTNPYQTETSKNNFYAGFPLDRNSLSALIMDTYTSLHITGQSLFSYDIKNNIISLNISFKTDTLPTLTTSGTHSQNKGGVEFGASRPHINYNTALKRETLPIEMSSKTKITVETSEQLYYISTLKYRPVPKTGSNAEKYYNYAKNILLNIITDSMTDVEKAHAIYDWIMFKVNYDYVLTSKTNMSVADSVKYEAYYINGVFNDTRPYAVCDGISKAYALMCNLENIDCIRVAGMAGDDYKTSSWGGHAWNKVKIDGQWYIVDATWGDEIIAFKGRNLTAQNVESAMHRYFLLTDKQVEKNRIEEKVNDYPRTALSEYNWYDDDIIYGDGYVDFYLNGTTQNVASEAEKLARYIAAEVSSGKTRYASNYSKSIAGYTALQKDCRYILFDIRINKNLSGLFAISNKDNPLAKTLSNLGFASNEVFYATSENVNDFYLIIVIYV